MLPRETPCYLCEDVPCVKACPSGALDPALEDVRETRIGLAALIDQENCLSHQGLRCEICHRECPLIDKAITVTVKPREKSKHAVFVPVVHSDACTGCGICEKVCPLERSAIRIFPVELAQGELGAHYELGGIERQKLLEGEAEAPDPDDALRYLNEEAP